MSAMVIAHFHARSDKLQEVEATLRAALPDTRTFEGCIDLKTYFEPETHTFTLLEEWESHEHYERYLAWRIENGLADLLEPLLEGGMAGFTPRKLSATDI